MKYDGSLTFLASQLITENDNDQVLTHEIPQITDYNKTELLKRLRVSKFNSANSMDTRCTELRKISAQINSNSVSSVYYPYCGADVTHVFLLFPSCTTAVGFGRDEFGEVENLNYYNENDDFILAPTGHSGGFDSHQYHEEQGSKYPDNQYKVCPDILLRITQTLGGEVLSVERKQLGDTVEDSVHEIKFLLDNIERSFIYAQYEINFALILPSNSSPIRDFLVSQNPDALLLKAIPDVLLEYPDGLAVTKASVTQESQIVLSDARTYNWQKRSTEKPQPQPVFSNSAKLQSISLYFTFGYGSVLFIGNGAQLKGHSKNETEVLPDDLPCQIPTCSTQDNLVEELKENKPVLPPTTKSELPLTNTMSNRDAFFSPLKFWREKFKRSKSIPKVIPSSEGSSYNP
ncbi:hypothetical protein [Legionella hackeliae]|uniref:Uncharacterized protein n=1 Tax=Legionella hackeliae TaxID=449 RepID=A0A0A8UTU0_LEGHA|nr:hypothetical protein [Legionella hackeliae]KTD09719.1 hypothetical protein Lhac_2087 [Legionella hackeliae]CEK10956.1 protein of unknown function [Legionella hackeliae]STX47694.1 Uncharacterised protein [Legionella hackeliae]